MKTLLALLICFALFTNCCTAEDLVASCRQKGFDPAHLSCDTCTLLSSDKALSQFEEECKSCCQAWRPNQVVNPDAIVGSFVGRYKSAVLRFEQSSLEGYDEVKQFVEEDKAEVLKEKGDKAFFLEEVASKKQSMNDFFSLFGGSSRTPPTIHFYKTSGKNKGEADEVVPLRGFKRDDIKDMLMTVLPS